MDIESNEFLELILMFAIGIPVVFDETERIPQNDSVLTGTLYYHEIMASINIHRFRVIAKMDKQTFLRLLALLEERGGLGGSEKICTGEKLLIFIHLLTDHASRDIGERWQHPTSTISAVTHEVAICFMSLHGALFRKPPPDEIPPHIATNPKFSPFFDGCIGALDGSHIPAVVRSGVVGVFRNRKGVVTQNVLAVCDFDGLFTYVLAGNDNLCASQFV